MSPAVAQKQEQVNAAGQHFNLSISQSRFFITQARYPAFVGAWGTGKSLALIARAMRYSNDYKDNLGIIFRKEYVDLRDSTMNDFEKYTGLRASSKREVLLRNGSKIMFRHIEELNNIQNVNLGWFAIEQAEELDSDDPFFTLFGRLRRSGVPHTGFIVANTKGHNWVWKLWKDGGMVKTIRQLMANDPKLFGDIKNPEEVAPLFEDVTYNHTDHLDPHFLASLQILKIQKPKTYARFVENSWDDGDIQDVIIQSSWVTAATKMDLLMRPPIRRVVSIDVARGGSDFSVFSAIEGSNLEHREQGLYKEIGWEQHNTRNTMELVGLAQRFARKHDINTYVVDEIGVGAGVADRLAELAHEENSKEIGKKDYQVIMVNAAEKSTREGCYNRRAEIFDNAAEIFESGRVELMPDHEELIEELPWTKWKPLKSNAILQAESKDDIRDPKKGHGRSPDHADAFCNGLWALPQAKIAVKRDGYTRPKKSAYDLNPATV